MSRPHTSVAVYHTHFVLNARSVFSTGCRVFVRKSFSRRGLRRQPTLVTSRRGAREIMRTRG